MQYVLRFCKLFKKDFFFYLGREVLQDPRILSSASSGPKGIWVLPKPGPKTILGPAKVIWFRVVNSERIIKLLKLFY